MNKPIVRLLAIFFAVLLGSGVLVYFILDRTSPTASPDNTVATSPNGATTTTPNTTRNEERANRSFFSELFGRDTDTGTNGGKEIAAVRVLFRFLLAALLASLLAFARRRSPLVKKRNPYVAQTQILLAVVAAAMMMIVGDSAARAFGIFAAASLVRFRTNIRDPKETTVLLICLGVGLAAGVGRIDMAVILTLFVLVTLLILEYFEEAQVFRAMQLCVSTRNVERTNEVLKRIFADHDFEIELRELDRETEDDPMGTLTYLVDLNTRVSTNKLSEAILAADPENIDRVEWDQKKSSTYIYN